MRSEIWKANSQAEGGVRDRFVEERLHQQYIFIEGTYLMEILLKGAIKSFTSWEQYQPSPPVGVAKGK